MGSSEGRGREDALQAELHNVERRLRTLVELAPIAIWITEDDHLTFANRAAGDLMDAGSSATLVGQSVYSMLSADDHAEFRRMLTQALSHQGRLGRLQARLLSCKGEVREVEIALAALPDHGRTSVQMVISDISLRNRELREIERSRELLRGLSANLVEAREEERRRIARELHDELGQRLSALKMDITDCAQSGVLSTRKSRMSALLANLDEIMNSTRRIAAALRPAMLDDLGLTDAIEALANEFSRRQSVKVRLRLERVEPGADDKVSIAIYRMVQEALTNVSRHARATEVQVELRHDGTDLVVNVCDNGIGMPSQPLRAREGRFGLIGMQERAEALGGRLKLDSPPGGGSCVTICVPATARAPATMVAGAPGQP